MSSKRHIKQTTKEHESEMIAKDNTRSALQPSGHRSCLLTHTHTHMLFCISTELVISPGIGSEGKSVNTHRNGK